MNIPYILLDENKDIIISSNSECIICSDILDNKEIIVLRCKHYFHLKCIELWFKNKRTCPYCRQYIDEDKDKEVKYDDKLGIMLSILITILFCFILLILLIYL